MSPVRRVLALALLALAASCALLPDERLSGERRALERARERWEAAGVTHYTFVLRQRCPGCASGPVSITVRDGFFHSARDAGGRVPEEYLEGFRTVDEIFSTVLVAIGRRPAELDARYDPALGYPLLVTADPNRYYDGEEWRIELTGFTPGTPPAS